jgi:hypothetical protein
VRNPYIIDQLPLELKVIIKKKAKQTGGKQKDKGHLDLGGPSKIRNELRFFYLILKQRYN